MEISICSFSFHRLLAAGKQDIFRYITDCKDLGCTHLDAWNVHLAVIGEGDKAVTPDQVNSSKLLSSQEEDYLASIKVAADEAGLPFGTLAVDGAHIYEPEADARNINRTRAYRWLEVGERLGAAQIRIDAGGPSEMPDESYVLIKEGYNDLIERGRAKGIEIVVENHWGPTAIPENVVKLLEDIPGLGYLYDTHNWKPELRDEGRKRCVKYATATHIKTFEWNAQGEEVGDDVLPAMHLLLESGYKGIWGIESVPRDGDEYAGAAKTVALIKKVVGA